TAPVRMPEVRPARHRVWLALALVAIVIAGIALVWPRQQRVAEGGAAHAVRRPVQLTTSPGLDLHPALSPMGDAIAFVSDRTGAFEIVVRALDGSATDVPLTSDGGQNVQPAWSPDGRVIAYHSQARGGIWIVPSRGGTPRQVASEGSRPAWSPDGASIAFQSDEHTDATPFGVAAQSGSTIRMMSIDGDGVHDLTRSGQPTGGHALPAWSPDGRYLTFAVFDGGPSNGLWLLERASGAVRLLRAGDAAYESVFAPDGSSIYVAGGDALITRLPFNPRSGAVREDAVESIPVPGVPGVRGLSLSPDGRQLALAGLDLNSQIWAQTVTASGTPRGLPIALTSDTSQRNSLPVVSPDGKAVAYMSSRRGEQPNLWVMDTDGGHPRQLTSGRALLSQPDWSGDGRQVTLLARGEEGPVLMSVDVTTRTTGVAFDLAHLRNAEGGGALAEVRLSPSAGAVAVSFRDPPTGRRTLYVAGRDSTTPRRLTDGSTSVGYPVWSPGERTIAVEVKDGSSTHAAVVDVETGDMRGLTAARGQTWVRSWSPDGQWILAAMLRDGLWSVRALHAQAGREQSIVPPAPPRVFLRYPDWSPTGELVVFERAEMTGNIWLLDTSAP
ncbi:MAG TPA: hypothetical protein VIY56_05480, partial [Vicinamibacterales bacterium]